MLSGWIIINIIKLIGKYIISKYQFYYIIKIKYLYIKYKIWIYIYIYIYIYNNTCILYAYDTLYVYLLKFIMYWNITDMLKF
jgi:hypothetical protein